MVFDGDVSLSIFVLETGTHYYYRTFATNSAGTSWADTTSGFTTASTGGATQHSITITSPRNGTVVPGGVVMVADGGTTDFVITPDQFYYISGVLTNSGAVAIDDPAGFTYTWSNITASGTLEAVLT